jgi:WS/DGAT/MGAT family acyltransferase
VPLAAIKAVGAPVGATINDVLLAALTGAVRRYLLEQRLGERPVPLHAIVPVDLRPAGRGLELGNAFGLTFLALPVDEETPSARLHATKRQMDAIKRSPEAPVFLSILGLFGQLPRTAQDAASSLFASKATMVMTNVAGPTDRCTLAGHPVEEIVFWVPHPVQLGVGVSLLSYADQATVGVETDAGVVSTPTVLTDYILEEIEALQERGRDVPESAQMVEDLEAQ